MILTNQRCFKLFAYICILMIPLQACFGFQEKEYPKFQKSDDFQTLFGRKILTPFKDLKNVNSNKARRWVRQQNKRVSESLERGEEYQQLVDHYKKVLTTVSIQWKRKKKNTTVFFDDTQNEPAKLMIQRTGQKPTLLLDVNKLFEGSRNVRYMIHDFETSPDGQYLLFSCSQDGVRARTLYCMDTETKEVTNYGYNLGLGQYYYWDNDSDGFFFTNRIDLESVTLSYYQIPEILYPNSPNKPQWTKKIPSPLPTSPTIYLSDSGNRLALVQEHFTSKETSVSFFDTSDRSKILPLGTLSHTKHLTISMLGLDDANAFCLIDQPNHPPKIVKIDQKGPSPKTWKKISTGISATMKRGQLEGDQLFMECLSHGASELYRFDLKTKKLLNYVLPGYGHVSSIYIDDDSQEVIVLFSSPVHWYSILHYNMETGKLIKTEQRQSLPSLEDFEVKRMFAQSDDGEKIPFYVCKKKSTQFPAPTLAAGYGGFSIPYEIDFSAGRLVWMELGGVFVVTNIRGGGEYGRSWHVAGIKEKRQNVFNDFRSILETLIHKKITVPSQLGATGSSNGGLLVAAVINQNPELLNAALVDIGVLDMIFESAWKQEYGDPKKESDFKYLFKYSPIHNINKKKKYPAIFVQTGKKDTTVPPNHSYRYAATLQDNPHPQSGTVFLKAIPHVAHGSHRTDIGAKVLATTTRFFARELGLKIQPKKFLKIDIKTPSTPQQNNKSLLEHFFGSN